MAVSEFMRSRAGGSTVDLFEFVYGDQPGDYWGYTNSVTAIDWGGKTYSPAPITHGGFESKGKGSDNGLNVTVSPDMAISELFRGTLPRRVIYLRVYTGDLADQETPTGWLDTGDQFGLIWFGRVVEKNRKLNEVTLTCSTLGAGMKEPGLSRFYQRECGHRLYGPYCQADKDAAKTTVEVVDGNGLAIELAEGWEGSRNQRDFIGGLAEWETSTGREYRRIVGVGNEFVRVDSPCVGLSPAVDLDLFLGCARTLDACENLHDNIVNYGGQFAIPQINPVNRNNHT